MQTLYIYIIGSEGRGHKQGKRASNMARIVVSLNCIRGKDGGRIAFDIMHARGGED